MPGGFWGTEINLASGDNTTISHDFTIDENWPYFTEDKNCEFGCFVQGNDKEIYEGAVLPFGDPTGGVEESLVEVISCEIPSFLQDGNLELSVEKNTEVEISLYGTTGRNIETIFTGSLSTGKHRLEVDTHSLSQGIYFLAIKASGLVQTKKLVVLE
ncbi:T9SS type A sorting domain-containing protein [candidate division WOR-3 bacterium]|nr:T9SS type A sorting domain-containing protein [candidate division WOR-3 bacterium]